MTTPSEHRGTRRSPTPTSELEHVRRDIIRLLRDLRGAFDELLVQSEIGEMNVRDALAARVEQIDQAWFNLKRCTREQVEEERTKVATFEQAAEEAAAEAADEHGHDSAAAG
ncbi:MAG TPA: hypothetical protein VK277_04130 [Acidimicrobiales bacterium]|nr:hypothetical protein [Acidimicrobiales bacterium]